MATRSRRPLGELSSHSASEGGRRRARRRARRQQSPRGDRLDLGDGGTHFSSAVAQIYGGRNLEADREGKQMEGWWRVREEASVEGERRPSGGLRHSRWGNLHHGHGAEPSPDEPLLKQQHDPFAHGVEQSPECKGISYQADECNL
ncbi:hypothetical protein Salat_2531900 [Sesamum alatum]|uniref:Uncharacterized protein n=1 Tax=Sesamum alatum TaxID=300844 RepID=A0AAE2CCG4_9LAMI|nr:hypothetical protein Salat_2531900 [Sesamum alatum]